MKFPSEHKELVHIIEIRDREMAGLGMKEEETVLLTEAPFPWYWLKST